MLLNPGSHRRLLVFLILLFTTAHAANAQEYSYVHYDIKDGLAGSLVYCGVQDHDGFLWFGTETGLSRFDGTHFQNFTTADGLPDNEIIRLFVDSKNRVWIMPFRNSICYYYKGKIYNQHNDTMLKRTNFETEIFGMSEDKNGDIVFLSTSSAYVLRNNQHFSKLTYRALKMGFFSAGVDDKGHTNILGLAMDGYKSRLGVFEAVDNQLKDIRDFRPGVTMTTKGSLFTPGLNIYGNNRFDTLVFADNKFKRKFAIPMPEGFVSLDKLNGSLVSINTRKASNIYDVQKMKLVYNFKKDNLNDIFEDNENDFWLLTDGNGIFRIGSTEIRSKVFTYGNENLPVYSFLKAKNSLYVGTIDYHIWKIDSLNPVVFSHNFSHLRNGRVIAMENLPDGSILAGTDNDIIRLKNSTEHLLMMNLYNIPDIVHINVKSMTLWGDTVLFGSGHNALQTVIRDTLAFDTLWTSRSTCAYKQDNIYYIGTLNGLYSLNSKKVISFLGEKIPVLQERINAIKESSDGTLWVSTNGHGIVAYKDGQVKYLVTEKEGLTSNICKSLFISGNDVWVGTEKGLNRLRCSNGNCQVLQITDADGLPSNTINAIYVDSNMVYVGTPLGMTYFDISRISVPSSCKLLLTSIHTTNNAWNFDTTGFTLPHKENAVQFDYVGISYRSGGEITYRYRLIGLDTTWRSTHQTSLNYPSLPSGKYDLQITATNKFGAKSEMASISFTIEHLLWEKIWFKIAIAVLVAVGIWLFVNFRIKFIRKQEDNKLQVTQRINELEQMALKAQMNPHFIFNCLNSIQQYVIDKNTVGANKFLTEFARLIRLTLDLSSRAEVSLEDEIRYLSTYLELEKTKLEDQFNYQVIVENKVNKTNCQIPPMILQPYIENAIRHGVRYRNDNEGMIKILFLQNETYLTCTISDNGIGREKSKILKGQARIPIEYQSKGMTLTAKRIEMINSYSTAPILVEVGSANENDHEYPGTKVTVNFPVKEVYSDLN